MFIGNTHDGTVCKINDGLHSIVFAASDKENAQPTYKGGIGFCPNLATCDNTDDALAIDPRPGNATSNNAADNIALLDRAVARIPGRYRRRMLIRLDGAGFSDL